MEERFKSYIMSGGTSAFPSREELDALLRSYPWFMTARMLRGIAPADGEGIDTTGHPTLRDELLKLHLSASPTPKSQLTPVLAGDYKSYSNGIIIDSFLHKGEHRIVPDENTSDGDITPAAQASPTAGIVTEQLADIYMKQQLWRQAREVYEKLSLLYPKKSIYFAEIIARIDEKIENN